MMALWVLQTVLDLLFIGALALWWLERRHRAPAHTSEERIQESLSHWGRRVHGLETEMEEYRQKIQLQLNSLTKLGEEAKAILLRGQQRVTNFSPSREEEELRSLLRPKASLSPPADTIPTLHELENTRVRLKSDMLLDLKTLLKDQLA